MCYNKFITSDTSFECTRPDFLALTIIHACVEKWLIAESIITKIGFCHVSLFFWDLRWESIGHDLLMSENLSRVFFTVLFRDL